MSLPPYFRRKSFGIIHLQYFGRALSLTGTAKTFCGLSTLTSIASLILIKKAEYVWSSRGVVEH